MIIRTPKFARRMVCKYLVKMIEEETGIRSDIEIYNVSIVTDKEDIGVYASVSIDMNKKDLKKFIKESRKTES